jgi:hypothetical protein
VSFVFRDLPADSSELESFGGFAVAAAPDRAHGGPPEEPVELELELPAARFTPIPQAYELRWGRVVPVRHWHNAPMVPNSLLLALFMVPALSGAAVLAIGMMRW